MIKVLKLDCFRYGSATPTPPGTNAARSYFSNFFLRPELILDRRSTPDYVEKRVSDGDSVRFRPTPVARHDTHSTPSYLDDSSGGASDGISFQSTTSSSDASRDLSDPPSERQAARSNIVNTFGRILPPVSRQMNRRYGKSGLRVLFRC